MLNFLRNILLGILNFLRNILLGVLNFLRNILLGVLNFLRNILRYIFETKSEKNLKEIKPLLDKINEEYTMLYSLSNDELREETNKLRGIIQENIKKEKDDYKRAKDAFIKNTSIEKSVIDKLEANIKNTSEKLKNKKEDVLMEILPKAFAIVKDTARRFTENEEIRVSVTSFDRILFAKNRDYININGDEAIWKTTWNVMKHSIKWNMIHYDEQLIGGIVLHQGKIAEMATGEGKTLVSTLPIFLNALTGDGVHLVTVNDYLAKRDCMWNRPIFEFHGLTVACIDETDPGSNERRKAYAADITYGTNNEFGFDYLRDNMSSAEKELVQRQHNYAIVDEVDSVLIDDARTPLIISGPTDYDNTKDYSTFQPFVKNLVDEQKKIVNKFLLEAKDGIAKGIKNEETGLALFRAYRGLPKNKDLIKFLSEPGIKLFMEENEAIYLENNCQRMPEVDKELFFYIEEKFRNVELTDKGFEFISRQAGNSDFFKLPDIGIEIDKIEKDSESTDREKEIQKKLIFQNYKLKSKRVHVIQQLLKAYTLFEKEVDYVVLGGRVLIVDEQTGRILDGRRYSDGLHQALEAKEFVKIEKPSQTHATITLQNYFRLYSKLAGMTGTAETEAAEFLDIYKLDVVVIPTHKKMIREDKDDIVFKTARAKFNEIINMVIELSKSGRPVLVGTTSVEISELLSKMLKMKKIQHQVLNAKYHQQEAEIVAKAGVSGTVTIATNMAGRGTDIKLDEKALKAGGLAIIGSERHESRRVDRQLRGRAGRQGDPGSSQFLVSFEDDLMRKTIGNSSAQRFIDTLADDEVIQSGMVTRSIERAQKKVEENNFGYRRRLLEYDDVLNTQREKIYTTRRNALKKEIVNSDVFNILLYVVKKYILQQEDPEEQLNYSEVKNRYFEITDLDFFETEKEFDDELYDDILKKIYYNFIEIYKNKCLEIFKKVSLDMQNIPEDKAKMRKITIAAEQFIIDIDVDFENNKFTSEQLAGEYLMRLIVAEVSINFIDEYWKKHLRNIDDLKKSVQNAYYEQKDPLLIFKFESFELFMGMITKINSNIVEFLFKAKVLNDEEKEKYISDLSVGRINLQQEILEKQIQMQMKKKLKTLLN